ncbi:MAG TPA: vitamin B12-dependent ribonucleotide reductase [Solirubrobacterales bacterium]|jgi:ribonucleoside-diphosphate reductase alpha chain|nr:vitamin B12-dependent ribonucleotide reductase [Solirubrobacterales bacterium]
MAKTAEKLGTDSLQGLAIERKFSKAGVHPFDQIEWEIRDAVIGNPESPAFEQRGVEFPKSWSQNATNIVAQKYFRGQLGSPERESSVKQMIGRVAGTISNWGREGGYFASEDDADAFEMELTSILLNQKAAFNSPVWFNVGFEEKPQCSACFILSVEDTMESILGWNTKEGNIFRGGSGSGINLSNIRGSMEPLQKGGTASGPVSFMRGADAWAGTIKSGGKTRRAAKMVVLDVDHPDIEHFIWCKADEEKKAEALREAGFDMSIDGEGFTSIQYQNANNSVRVSDAFMEAVEAGEDWDLTARTTGESVKTLDARELMNQIADAAWRCADPGIQYDTIINRWHTCPESGRINASNPCSEYMHVDDSACNLASLNLMKFRREDGSFDTAEFEHAVDIVFLAQEIVVGFSSYPTEEITANAFAFRQLGLGYANLGALLMSDGLPYDSDEGRNVAAAITALMTGRAYRQSALIAAGATGPYDEYAKNREPHNGVMRMHRDAAYDVDGTGIKGELLEAAQRAWDEAVELGDEHGYRNAQATVLAPTGTISFLMDCDTTGIEPDFSLVKFKELVGGGSMTIVNKSVPMALDAMGYSEAEIDQINAHIAEKNTIVGAPGLKDEHLPVFDVAVGERAISHTGHIDMMAATQPFISGAISKTVNLPQTATVEDIADAYTRGWNGGLKALAIYRDGSKTAQALRTDAQDEKQAEAEVVMAQPVRKKMPRERESITHKFSIAGHEGYITAGKYDDGTVGEIFLTDIGKEGSTMRGLLNAFATSISLGLQYGVPLETFVRKFSYMRFEPEGMTGNPEIPFAKSLPDYIMRWVASRFIEDTEALEELGIMTQEVRNKKEAETTQMSIGLSSDTAGPANGHAKPGNGNGGATIKPGTTVAAASAMTDSPPVVPAKMQGLDLGPACEQCGGMMQRTGSCYTCSSCGNNTGCG